MRVIINSKTQGVFLQYCFGLPFFSAVPSIYAHATTFADEADAKEFIARCFEDDEFPKDLEFLSADTDSSEASMDECVAAGVKPWAVRHMGSPIWWDTRSSSDQGSTRDGMSRSLTHLMANQMSAGGKVFVFDKG